ncbi:hypothetical protein KQ41_06235 [Lysinibacillus fusiformis]|uniref:Uncharacterized protein n=1 Tax=Lysinibacillus sphaericus TaxID=1421 RepID=A0A6H0A0N8_LYSSH|nr:MULTISPECIES: hypothetical protein [Lysinibacillus]KGA83643.1 hypothetical protein KQ41_06235 [Lysinibacillus fusiformis]QIS31123.1 hypothetical protein [Lysinibacillus sphaericus]QPA61322.1 hypothetical protein INQ55_23615 [Lysinibacillus sphaericus]
MPLIILPVLLLAIFGINSLSTFFLEENVLFSLGNAFNFLFTWGYLEIDNTKKFASLYKTLNIMKTIFWMSICLFIIFQLKKQFTKSKAKKNGEDTQ